MTHLRASRWPDLRAPAGALAAMLLLAVAPPSAAASPAADAPVPGRGAGPVVLEGDFEQGGLVFGRTDPGAEIHLDGTPVRVGEDGGFVFGFDRDAGREAVLEITGPDGERVTERLSVAAREWDVQRIDGLPPQQVTPDEAALERIRREAVLINAARAADTAAEDFRGGFIWPVIGRISGIYGSQRILNGEPRQPHLGIDIAAPTGTPVVAAAPGSVTLAEADLFFTGGTVILDHGHGISTVYSHLDAVEVEVGERLEQGERLGTVGATGRVTGPHLDWRVNWFQTRVDPARLVGPMPAP